MVTAMVLVTVRRDKVNEVAAALADMAGSVRSIPLPAATTSR